MPSSTLLRTPQGTQQAMGRKAKTGARKAKVAASKAHGIDQLTTEARNKDQISSDTVRDEASASQTEARHVPTTNAGVACELPHHGQFQKGASQVFQAAAALQQDKNSPLLSPGNVPQNQAAAIDNVVLQLLLEQQRAKRQEEEHQFRLMQTLARRMPSKQGANEHVTDDSWRTKSADPNISSLAGAGDGGQSGGISSALNSLQQQILQGGPPTRENVLLLQLLHQQKSLPVEGVMPMGNYNLQREFHPSTTPQGYGGHHAIWPSGSSSTTRASQGFGFLTQPPPHAVAYNKDQLRRLQALSLMPPLHQFVPHPSLSSMVHSLPSSNPSEAFPGAGFRDTGVAEPATTSYDLVPATPVNNELMQRAKELVSLSQADMSTWRNTRRRFREEDDKFNDGGNHNGGVDHEDDDDEGMNDSKPPSRKRAKGSI